MTANGAAGTTAEAMKKTIYLDGMSDEEMNGAYKTLTWFLLNVDPKVAIEIANAVWYKKQLTAKETFKDVLSKFYDADAQPADFADPNTKNVINDWIANKTHDKIKDMLDQIPSAAVMYLVNAIYFKAQWRYRFDEKDTKPRPFFLADGTEIQTPTMHGDKMNVTMYANDQYQLVGLPYGNGQFSMVVLLPRDGVALNDVIGQLDQQQFSDDMSSADTLTMGVYMPKFKIEFKTLLNNMLSEMGMGVAFSDKAGFSRFFEGSLPLQVSRVIHQAFLEVDEKGTEATAATIAEVVMTVAGLPPEIKFNRPFAFFIAEKHSNTILFAGKLSNPALLGQ